MPKVSHSSQSSRSSEKTRLGGFDKVFSWPFNDVLIKLQNIQNFCFKFQFLF